MPAADFIKRLANEQGVRDEIRKLRELWSEIEKDPEYTKVKNKISEATLESMALAINGDIDGLEFMGLRLKLMEAQLGFIKASHNAEFWIKFEEAMMVIAKITTRAIIASCLA